MRRFVDSGSPTQITKCAKTASICDPGAQTPSVRNRRGETDPCASFWCMFGCCENLDFARKSWFIFWKILVFAKQIWLFAKLLWTFCEKSGLCENSSGFAKIMDFAKVIDFFMFAKISGICNISGFCENVVFLVEDPHQKIVRLSSNKLLDPHQQRSTCQMHLPSTCRNRLASAFGVVFLLRHLHTTYNPLTERQTEGRKELTSSIVLTFSKTPNRFVLRNRFFHQKIGSSHVSYTHMTLPTICSV